MKGVGSAPTQGRLPSSNMTLPRSLLLALALTAFSCGPSDPTDPLFAQAEDEIVNGETTPAGSYGKTSGGVPGGTPPAGRGTGSTGRGPEGVAL